MDFITVTDCAVNIESTINIEKIVYFNDRKINLSTGQDIAISDKTYKEIKTYLNRKGHFITKLGD